MEVINAVVTVLCGLALLALGLIAYAVWRVMRLDLKRLNRKEEHYDGHRND